MSDFELVTIKKGEVKTIDSFIKAYNSIGHNMKALAVSAFSFLNSEDVNERKEFQKRCYDELHFSPSTLSFLKTAGYLYTLDERFKGFAYTNVIYFKKPIDTLEEINEATITQLFSNLYEMHWGTHNAHSKEYDTEMLQGLSQKDLKHLIDKYVKSLTEVDDSEEMAVDEDVSVGDGSEYESEETDETEETNEVMSHLTTITILDEDYNNLLESINNALNNPKTTKQTLIDILNKVNDVLIF